MSTIEKAAAKLVKRSNAPRSDAPQSAGVVPVTPEEISVGQAALQKGSLNVQPDASSLSTAPNSRPDRLCELDFEWLAESGFLVPGHDNQMQHQEFRRIKRPLLMNTQPQVAAQYAKPTNVIFITSALPEEGKTFVSLNLALSMAAELDRSVLLVDGDSAKGDMSRWLGIEGEEGLVDILTNQLTHGEGHAIQTNVDRLSVMSYGSKSPDLDELYASRLMKTLLDGLAQADPNRIILVDGPPLLATTEAAVLAQLMGQTLLVVEANKTPQSSVQSAVNMLQNSQLLSAVLNKSERFGATTYGYGYGYGYGAPGPDSAKAG